MSIENTTHLSEDGLYLKGVVINTRAHAFESKRSQPRLVGVVNVELSCGNEIVTWSQYFDPQENEEVQMAGKNVIASPAPERLSTVTLRVLRTKTFNQRLTVTDAEILENSAA